MATKRQRSVLATAHQQCRSAGTEVHRLVFGACAEYVAGAAVGGDVGAGDDWLSTINEVKFEIMELDTAEFKTWLKSRRDEAFADGARAAYLKVLRLVFEAQRSNPLSAELFELESKITELTNN